MKRWVLFFGLLLIGSVAGAATLHINQFGGINTDDSPLTLQNQTPDSQNVVTDDGPGIKGRKGYISFSTEVCTEMWEFPYSDGTRYILCANETNGTLKEATSDGVFTQISTIPTNVAITGSALGDKFFFSDSNTGLKYWDTSAITTVDATLTFTHLATWKGRLVGIGISGAERILYLSKYLDGTDFTLASNPTDTDPSQITVAGALNENITAIYASFQDLLIWFKNHSFGGIYGSNRSNFTQRTYSDTIGTGTPESVRDCAGILRFMGPDRRIWQFDGNTLSKTTEDIDNLMATVAQGDSNSRSNTQTTEADWENGTQTPSGFADTTSSPGDITLSSFSYTDTLTSDFSAGGCSPSGWCDTSNDNVRLTTSTAGSSFVDTTQSDFEAGSGVNTDTTTSSGDLLIQLTTGSYRESLWDSENGLTYCSGLSESFTATTDYFLTKVYTDMGCQNNGCYDSVALQIYSDNSGVPTTLLGSATNQIAINGDTFEYPSGITLTSGNRYWLYADVMGSCYYSGGPSDDWVGWYKNSAADGSELYGGIPSGFYGGPAAGTASGIYRYKTYGKNYKFLATLISRTFDTTITTDTWLWSWSTFTADATTPSGTSVTYKTQTSADSSTWDSLVSVVSGGTPSSTVRRYIRYQATLNGTGIATPTLSDVTIAQTDRIRPSVSYTSHNIDTAYTNPVYGLLTENDSLANGGTASFYTQTSSDGTSWDSRVAVTPGSQVPSASKRYVRYQIDLAASSYNSDTAIDDVTITAKSTGTFITQTVDFGPSISAYGPLVVNDTPDNGTITYAFSSAATSAGVGSSWTTISKGATPTGTVYRYGAVRAIYSIDVATEAPTISDITMNWTEGSAIKTASSFINNRYWLAVAISSTANNTILVYDKKGQWQEYTGENADCMTLYNSNLYFSNTNGTYEAEQGYSDNGAAIVSYYRTPDYAPNNLDLNSNFDYLYMTTENSDSTLATTFEINGIGTDYSMGSYQMNQEGGYQNFKLPFSMAEVQTGKMINFKWSVTGTTFWRIDNGTLYYQPLALPE